MRPLLLAIAGGAVFLAAALAGLPARLVHDLALRPAGIEADLVTGPVWNARLYRLTLAGQPFSQASARLAFWPLLTGTARVEIEAGDESATARGTLVARPGRIALRDASLAVEARRLPGVAGLPLTQTERIYAEIDRIVFEDGQCVEATGIVSTALLARLGPRYDLELPQIEGALGCAGDGVGLGYQGRSPVLEVTGSLRLGPDGYRWTSEAHTGEPGVIAVLLALGFEETGAAWRAEGEGRYR